MTSSLVGSEMCIRDRSIGLHPNVFSSLAPTDNSSVQQSMKQQQQVVEPVSYTHLTLPTICSV
eukprot:203980-Prorocentrum_lima.AAC.1